MPNRFVNCLRAVTDITGSTALASLKNEPIKAWEDNVILNLGRAAGRQVLAFIRPLGDAVHTEAGKEAFQVLDKAAYNLRLKMAQGVDLAKGAMKIVDPRGTFLDPGELVDDFYRADSELRVNAFFEGKLKADGLRGVEKEFVTLKSQMVDDLNNSKQFSPDSTLHPRKSFTLDDDIKSPLIKQLQEEGDGQTLPYEFSNTVAKQMYLRMLKTPDADSVAFHEWLGVVYPQLTKKSVFDPAIKKVLALREGFSPAEAKRFEMTINRIAGKKTPTQKIIDDVVEWVREEAGMPKMEFSPAAKGAMAISRGFYRGTMWANPGMALVNLTQNINTMAKYGPMQTFKGMANFASGPGRDLMRRNEAALLGEFHKFFRQDSFMSKLDESIGGFGLFNHAEYLNRGIAMHTGISDFMTKNKIESFSKFMELKKLDPAQFQAGMKTGLNAANDTQFLYSVVHQSPLLAGPISKLFLGQFMSYPINEAEFLWRNIKANPAMFTARWMALTGAASMATYYGAGVVLQGLGGGSGAPMAVDLWKEGHKDEAIWAAASGVYNFLPDTFAFERGLTPANGALVDTLKVFSAMEQGNETAITKSFANMTRSWSTMLPAFLTVRRLSEGVLTQMFQDGKRYEPGSEGSGRIGSGLEATGLVPAFNAVLDRYAGGAIPGIPKGQTGRLAQEETIGETAKTTLGLRSVSAETRSTDLNRSRTETNAFRGQRAALADQMAAAMEKKDNSAFQQLLEGAIKNQLVTDSKDLKGLIAGAVKQRHLDKTQRGEKQKSRAQKLNEMSNSMEDN